MGTLAYQIGILEDLLIGVVVSFILESAIKYTGNGVSMWERASMIIAWPLMALIFIFYFIKGMFNNE